MMPDVMIPSDLKQVESLILTLYEPNPPDVISKVQSTLSRLQSSPQAWLLARYLLERPDDKVRFFGALTIIIKLNTESSNLSDEDAIELLTALVGWYLATLQQMSSSLVVRKLSSALATFFLHFYRLWTHYVRHLAICLASGEALHVDALDSTIDIDLFIKELAPSHMQASLWVMTGIMEDATRLDLNAMANAGLYQSILVNMPDAMALIARSMTEEAFGGSVKQDSIRCLQSWVAFSQRMSARNNQVIDSLRLLIPAVIDSLIIEDLYDVAAELLIDILSNWPSLLLDSHYKMLSILFGTPWFKIRYERLVEGDYDFGSIRLAQILLSYGEARIPLLIQDKSAQNQSLLSSLCGLLSANGYPVADDKVFVPAVEFWSTFAESILDFLPSDIGSTDGHIAAETTHLLQAVSNAWRKTVCPAAEEFNAWDSCDRAAFFDARKDVVDLLQSSYTLIGPQLVQTFTALALSSLSILSWMELEAAVYCLGGLADCSRDDPHCDSALTAIFSSSLFTMLRADHANIPTRTRQTCITLIEQYTEYFERNSHLLPAALSLLFTEVGEEAMAVASSKSIHRLCSSCRVHLQGEIDNFLVEYQNLVAGGLLDCVSREKVIAALACITQAIPDDKIKYSACTQILGYIQQDVQQAINLIQSTQTDTLSTEFILPCSDILPDERPELHLGLRALRCLSGVARGFQAPSDVSIDVESTDQNNTKSTSELIRLQQQVMGIIENIRRMFAFSTEVTELICGILRSGFSEIDAGPFVLAPEDITYFLVGHQMATPRVGLMVGTACSFISSLRPQPLLDGHGILSQVSTWVVGLMRELPEPESDPELVQNGIDFVSRLLGKSPAIFFLVELQNATEFFLLFTLRVLDGKEPLPKAAAAEFWSIFVDLRPYESDLKEPLEKSMAMLGPLLMQSLVRNFGGNASRSELDRLAEPLKKLVSRHSMAKEWLKSSLHHSTFPSPRVSSEQKAMFVKKVISLRGSRATNQVIRDFWLGARGNNFAYAS